ncbi:MAG TPA: SET domain-containing protein-lysine N-methyltransferase [Gemmatimonadaceae bacterium]|nr:SET domain-containing protein-lysine N-methyltransferase [Gemmatimonadaceae bacterium]
MWATRTAVQESPLHGLGVFTLEPIPKGKIVSIWRRFVLYTEREYVHLSLKSPEVRRNSVRLVGTYFLHQPGGSLPDDYINHASDPNLICVAGVLMARRNIDCGEELTIDYRVYYSPITAEPFIDSASGVWIAGSSPREALLRACQAVVELLSQADDWNGE